MASDTPTPLTDKARLTIEERQRFAAGTGVLYELVNANFARRLERFIRRVAYEPVGHPEATHKEVLDMLVEEARALLEKRHDV